MHECSDELLDRFTLAIVPAGSTCSLAASVGIRTLHTAMLAIIKGCIQPIDVGKVDIYDSKGAPQQTVYCITVVAWGFLSHLLQVCCYRTLFGRMGCKDLCLWKGVDFGNTMARFG